MWRRLDDRRLLTVYKDGFPDRAAPVELLELLRNLQNHKASREVFAVTSLNILRLTTAHNYLDEDNHGAIFIDLLERDNVDIHYASPNSHFAATGRSCPLSEAEDYLELLFIRLFNDRPPVHKLLISRFSWWFSKFC